MAVDETNEKLVGVAVNGIKNKGQDQGEDEFLTWIDKQKDPKMYRIISFLQLITSDIDFFKDYDVDRVSKVLLFFKLKNKNLTIWMKKIHPNG